MNAKETILFIALSLTCAAAAADEPPVWKKLMTSADEARLAGRYDRAEDFYRGALAYTDMKKDVVASANCLKSLASCYMQDARYKEAEAKISQAISILEKGSAVDALLLPDCLDELAQILDKEGKHTEAEAALERAYGLYEQKAGSKSIDMAGNLIAQGNHYLDAGDLTKAQSKFTAAVNAMETSLGNDNPELAPVLLSLAKTLCKKDTRNPEAAKICQRAIELYKKMAAIPEAEYLDCVDTYIGFLRSTDNKTKADQLNASVRTQRASLANQQGYSLLQKDDCEKAVDKFKQAVDFDSGNTIARENLSYANNNLAVDRCQNHALEEAERLINSALEISKAIFGTDDQRVQGQMKNLALIQLRAGKLEDARKTYEQVLQVEERSKSTSQLELATTLVRLAEVKLLFGQQQAAEPNLVRALSIQSKFLNSSHPAIGVTYKLLGESYLAQNKYDDAHKNFIKAGLIIEGAFGPESSYAAKLWQDLAALAKGRNNPAQQEQYLNRAVSIGMKLKPPNGQLISNLIELSEYYADHESKEKATEQIRKAMALLQEGYAGDGSVVARCQGLLSKLGLKEESEKLPALTKKSDFAKVSHTEHFESLLYNGQLCYESDDYKGADFFYRQALAETKKYFSPDDLRLATALSGLSRCLYYEANIPVAEEYMRKVLSLRETTLGSDHFVTGRTWRTWGDILQKKGDYAEAEEAYKKSIEILDKQDQWSSLEKSDSWNNLSVLYRTQYRYNDATAALKNALDIREQVLSEPDLGCARIIGNMAQVCVDMKKQSKATDLFQKAEKIADSAPNRLDPIVKLIWSNHAIFLRQMTNETEAAQYDMRLKELETIKEAQPKVDGAFVTTYGTMYYPANAKRDKDVDFGGYMADLQKRIKQLWNPPKSSASKHCTVIFKIHSGGQISHLRLAQSSGVDSVDTASLEAVKLAKQVKPLPPGASTDIDIQFTFDYNVTHGRHEHSQADFTNNQQYGNKPTSTLNWIMRYLPVPLPYIPW